ncbi:MAG: CHAD domain-containing protein [Pseudomonadales bacterium]
MQFEEIEAKFLLADVSEGERVLRALAQFCRLVAADVEYVDDCYVDSAKRELLAAGLGCRIRQVEPSRGQRRWSLECKALAHGGESVKHRQETSQPLAGPVSLLELPSGPVRKVLDATLTTPPEVLLSLRNRRQHYHATIDESHEFDVCVDAVSVRDAADGELAVFHELEIEFLRGDPAALETLVRNLSTACSLTISRLGKLERGLWLTGARAALRVAWAPGQPAWPLLVEELAQDLRMIGMSRDVALEAMDPEGVHLLRTNVRRLRTALAIAEPWLVEEELQFTKAFRALAGALGELRDSEVFRGQTQELLQRLPAVKARVAEQVVGLLDAAHMAAGRQAQAVLAAPSTDILFRRFADFLERREDSRPELTVADLMRPQLLRRARAIRKFLRRRGRRLTDDDLHRLRILVKHLRYALEIFAPALEGRALRLAATLRRLQDRLGAHQDACVAVARTGQLAQQVPMGPHARELLVLLGRMQRQREIDARELRNTFLDRRGRKALNRPVRRLLRSL